MLYVTTRNKQDALTVARVLHADRGADGGFFLPFRIPKFSEEDIRELKERTFSQNVARLLNLFFSCRISSWDVDFCVGKYPVKIVSLGSRVLVGEVWHNLNENYSLMEKNLASKICKTGDTDEKPSSWVRIAIGIAVLFGLFGELQKMGLVGINQPLDIAVESGDFAAPVTAWYAREMGLPLETIICGCNDNSGIWDMLHMGEMNTGTVARQTATPEGDLIIPDNLERLISETLGVEECLRYCDVCRRGGVYTLSKEKLEQLRNGMFAAVISSDRMGSIISNVYKTADYVLDPYGALAYGALMDYRATNAGSKHVLLLSQRSPAQYGDVVSAAMNVTARELKQILKRK